MTVAMSFEIWFSRYDSLVAVYILLTYTKVVRICLWYFLVYASQNRRLIAALLVRLSVLFFLEIQEHLDQKLDRMGRKTVIRRAFMHFQVEVREKFIDRENTEHARKLYRHHCCKKTLFYLRRATHRASVIRRAIDRHCKVFDTMNACQKILSFLMIE